MTRLERGERRNSEKTLNWRLSLQALLLTVLVTGCFWSLAYIAPQLLSGRAENRASGCNLFLVLPDRNVGMRQRINAKFDFVDAMNFGSGRNISSDLPFDFSAELTPPATGKDTYYRISPVKISPVIVGSAGFMPVPVLPFDSGTVVVDSSGQILPVRFTHPAKYSPPPQNTLLCLFGDYPFCWGEIVQSCGDSNLDHYLLQQLLALNIKRGTYCVRWGSKTDV